MVIPRRFMTLPLLALALAPVGAASASSTKQRAVKGYAVPCLKADGQTWEFKAKPTSCALAEELTQERSLVPVKRLKWTTWTAKRARATGTVKGPAYSGKVVVVATKPKRCSSRRTIYTTVTVTIPKMGSIASATVACPA